MLNCAPIVPIGEIRPTSSDEYKKSYISLYEGGKEYAIVMRDNGISLTGDHVTAMIPIKTTKGVVEGIICVQWQMSDLDAEKILFLKHTIAAMVIYLVLMLIIGGKRANSDGIGRSKADSDEHVAEKFFCR